MESFKIVSVGTEAAASAEPVTPKNVPHRGGTENPSAAALKNKFGAAIKRVDVVWGETSVYIDAARAGEIVRWLHDDSTQQYDYLSDVTAVEYRDYDQPIEVVWHLRSLPFRRFLRIKAELAKGALAKGALAKGALAKGALAKGALAKGALAKGALAKGAPLVIDSVFPIYKAADWMERECYDMFGIEFRGHPDLRRLLMWEQYREGYPLRKDFPLRGRFSRSEQLRQALAQNPEAKYSMEELSVAEAFGELPADMRARLRAGERTGE